MNTKYVTSLEISKKLKDLGVTQESEFYWGKQLGFGGNNFRLDTRGDLIRYEMIITEVFGEKLFEEKYKYEMFISAYLTDELLEILPSAIEDEDETFRLTIEKTGENLYPYEVAYRMNIETLGISYRNELSNALGKMLITLIEQGLYKL